MQWEILALLRWLHKNYQQVLALEFAVEEINRDPYLLPNVTLGVHLHNTYHSDSRTLESSLKWLSGRNQTIPNYNCEEKRQSVAVIGGATSALSVQMGMLLELYKFPQVFSSWCTELCSSGFKKTVREGEAICCFDCTLCPEGEISDTGDPTALRDVTNRD